MNCEDECRESESLTDRIKRSLGLGEDETCRHEEINNGTPTRTRVSGTFVVKT